MTVIGGRACSAVRCETFEEDPTAQPYTIEVDAIAVCTGTNTFSSLPKFRGCEEFTGQIMHSVEYKSPEMFQGKRVLIVGSG